jgi:CDP-diacylglycerol--glycerol-3-phosphate 3-phosphatidyltransferase
MANAITLARLALLFALVAMAYWAPPRWQLLDPPLLLLIISLDGLDGWVARRRGETSVFGAVFDIAADRVVEAVLWLVLADLGLVPIWVAILFVTRGVLVDSIRYARVAAGGGVFDMTSRIGRFLVAGRFMRGAYGALKAVAFGWLLMLQPWPLLHPASWAEWLPVTTPVTAALVYACVALCLVRGLPVIAEFAQSAGLFGRMRDGGKPAAGYDLTRRSA